VTEPAGSIAGSPVRVDFFAGQVLSPDDMRAEQDYHRGMRYLHNRLLHGRGVVDGFAVEAVDGGIHVSPGLALDPLGRELVLGDRAVLDLPPEAGVQEQTTWWVVATWDEVPSAPVAHAEGNRFSRWIERCALHIDPVAPDATGPGLGIATLSATAGTVAEIDTSGRRLVPGS
jgi:hypothetical protein